MFLYFANNNRKTQNMLRIAVASKNPVKLEAVRDGLSAFLSDNLQIDGFSVESGVSDQPMSEMETLAGATNRVNKLIEKYSGYDFYVGIEGGIDASSGEMLAFAWVSISNSEKKGKARTATFILPQKIAELIYKGFELGDADDIVFGKQNSKQQNGAVGLLTDNVITRKSLYMPAVQMAFIPFINNDLY